MTTFGMKNEKCKIKNRPCLVCTRNSCVHLKQSLFYIFIFLIAICSCNDNQPINAENCKMSYTKTEAISVDTVITFDPVSYAEKLWVIRYYFQEDEIEKIICNDTLRHDSTSNLVNVVGTIRGDKRRYLLKEQQYKLLNEMKN